MFPQQTLLRSVQALLLAISLSTTSYAQPLHVIWDRSGLTDSSAYGYAILPLGDQNNDGFADWAVYAQGNSAGTGYHGTRASYLEFFRGGNPLPAEPYYVFREDSATYHQTWYATVLGDINGDGYQDWMVSFWPQSSPPTYTEGIFFGGHGASSTPDLEWTLADGIGLYPLANFNGDGHGDFNGDGDDDIFCYDFNTHIARVYYGGNPMDTIPDWVLHQPPQGFIQSIPYAVGDFNGDGASDFMCFNPNPPYNLAIFLGGSNPDTVPAYSWSNMQWPIGGVKSLNGDAADEFLLDLGIHFGGLVLHPEPTTIINSGAGHEAISAGDFNHDGYNDLILLSPQCADNQFGCLDLHLGHPWINPDPVFTIEAWTDPLNLIGIYTAAALGDVNGDGVDDIAIGAWDDYAYLGWRGRCVILSGDTSLVAAAHQTRPKIPQRLEVSAYPNPFNGETTLRLQIPASSEPVTLTTFNVLGQEVQRAVLPPFTGEYIYRYRAQDLSSGLYLLRVEAGSCQTTQKLMLLR